MLLEETRSKRLLMVFKLELDLYFLQLHVTLKCKTEEIIWVKWQTRISMIDVIWNENILWLCQLEKIRSKRKNREYAKERDSVTTNDKPTVTKYWVRFGSVTFWNRWLALPSYTNQFIVWWKKKKTKRIGITPGIGNVMWHLLLRDKPLLTEQCEDCP